MLDTMVIVDAAKSRKSMSYCRRRFGRQCRFVTSSISVSEATRVLARVSDYNGDEAALRIVSALELGNYSKEEARQVMLEWNDQNDQEPEPFSDRELLRVVDYVYRRGGYAFSCRDQFIRRSCPHNDTEKSGKHEKETTDIPDADGK